jgi:phytol kinase
LSLGLNSLIIKYVLYFMINIITDMIPSFEKILVASPISILAILSIAYLSGYLKLKKELKTNYTRKIFHFTIFSTAGLMGLFLGFPGVIVFGSWAGIFILIIIRLGDGNIFYEGMAREQDSPHRSFYIIVPFLSTAIAGMLDNILFGQLALIGYLVAGWGDAVGEPVGVRFGRHKYRVPSRKKVVCYRSIEGSLAVFLTSTFASFLVLFNVLNEPLAVSAMTASIAGFTTAIVEAFSPHGVDNFTTQFFSCLVGFLIVTNI